VDRNPRFHPVKAGRARESLSSWRCNLSLAFPAPNGENDADGESRPARGTSKGSEVRSMGFWYYFWTINFIVAGSAFVFITVIVLVRGSHDLRSMFARLKESAITRASGAPPPPPKP
jgi:hypothetical protein